MSLRVAQVLLTVVIFTLVMAGVGWVASWAVPIFVDWGVAHVGLGALWAGFLLVMAALAYVGYWRPARTRT